MRRIVLFVLVIGAAIAAGAGPALAFCGLPVTFGGSAGCAPAGLCVVESPAGLVNPTGAFWAKGLGNFTGTAGVDSGTCDLLTCAGTTGWLIDAGLGAANYLSGDWSNPAVDGCIDLQPATTPMVVALHDFNPATGEAYWALLTSGGNSDPLTGQTGIWQYNFTGTSNYVMTPIPRLRIVGSTRTTTPVGVALNVAGVAAADADDGFYPASDSAVVTPPTFSSLVAGYRVYARTVPRNAAPPDSRQLAGWTPVSAVTPLGSPATTDAIPCSSAGGDDAYVAASMVLDSGYQLPLGGNSVRVSCGATLATPGGRPDRPGVGKGRGR